MSGDFLGGQRVSAQRCSLCVPLLSPSVRLPHLCGYLCAAVSWQPPATTVQLPLHNYLCGAIHRQLRLIAGCLPSPNAAVLGSCTQCTQHKICLTQTSAHVPHTKQQGSIVEMLVAVATKCKSVQHDSGPFSMEECAHVDGAFAAVPWWVD